jgi:hypothetical protein
MPLLRLRGTPLLDEDFSACTSQHYAPMEQVLRRLISLLDSPDATTGSK